MEPLAINAHIAIFPSFVIVVVLAVGLVWALKRPYHAYLFSVFVPLAMAIPTMTFTRTKTLGPYFNLYDACLIVMLVAVTAERLSQDSSLRLPSALMALLAVLALGYGITISQYGFSYETLRALRWAINVPLYLFGGLVMLRDQTRHRDLLAVLLIAAVIAEAQHLYLVVTSPALDDPSQLGQIRSSMFQLAKGEAWLLAGPYLVGRSATRPWLQFAVAALFLTAAITTQTRTLAMGVAGGLVLYWFFFARTDTTRSRLYLCTSVLVLSLTLLVLVPRLNLGKAASNFSERITGLFSEGVVDDSALARRQALSLEGSDWIDGSPFTIVFGNGLDYFEKKYNIGRYEVNDSIAFGHLGYVTYLSQLGAFGFLVYACWFPLAVIRRARAMYFKSFTPPTHHLAALTGAAFLYGTVAFMFSGHYLVNDVMAGTLAGFVFAMSPSRRRVR